MSRLEEIQNQLKELRLYREYLLNLKAFNNINSLETKNKIKIKNN